MGRGRAVGVLLVISLVASASPISGAHKPFYKASVDDLAGGSWEAHFVWLRSDYFNYAGDVWWQVSADAPGRVDILFFNLRNFEAFQSGQPARPLVDPLLSVSDGSQYISGLTGDLPYFLVLRNPSATSARVNWTIFADIDWKRWQGEPPGPEWNLTVAQDSPALNLSDSWETTFTSPAVYVYFCEPHVDMTGIVEVVDSNETPVRVAVQIRDMGFHPEVIRIPVGSTVNWTNLDNTTHSVNLALVPGGFVIPPEATAGPPFAPIAVAVAVSAVAVALLVLRRRRRVLEGSSKMDTRHRTEANEGNKHK